MRSFCPSFRNCEVGVVRIGDRQINNGGYHLEAGPASGPHSLGQRLDHFLKIPDSRRRMASAYRGSRASNATPSSACSTISSATWVSMFSIARRIFEIYRWRRRSRLGPALTGIVGLDDRLDRHIGYFCPILGHEPEGRGRPVWMARRVELDSRQLGVEEWLQALGCVAL